MENVSISPIATTTRSSGGTIAGCVVAHLGLGFLWLVISLVAYMDKFLFATGGGSVDAVGTLAALAWVVAGIVISILLADGRRRVWLVSVVWFVVSLTAVLVAVKLATPVYQACWC